MYPLNLPHVDANVANIARAWNYMVGGKDNFAVDRAAAERIFATAPVIAVAAPASRAFLRRAVTHLVGEAGVRQFVDIGTGLPTAGNTHEVAQSIAPRCRVVYVDNDPVVLAHARALLVSAPEGATSYLDADAREPARIIKAAGSLIDFGEPVAFMLIDLLPFIADEAVASSIIPELLAAACPGSYVAILHPASDLDPAMVEAERVWNQLAAARIRLRSREQMSGYLAGLELVEPGLVTIAEWHPDPADPAFGQQIPVYGVVARKPVTAPLSDSACPENSGMF